MTASGCATVLIVDDERFFRSVLGDILTGHGFTVVAEAGGGEEAVEKFRNTRPSLVLMDIYMPDKNGIAATREILSIDPDARILVCSGTGYDDDIDAALKAGARGIIYKPFFDQEVIGAVRNIMTC